MRQYFYKDESGQIKKFVYCMRGCETPFRQDQIGYEISKVSDHDYICKGCANVLRLEGVRPVFNKFREPIKTVDTPVVDEPLEKEETKVLEEIHEPLEKIKELLEEEVPEPVLPKIEKPLDSTNLFVYVVKCKDNTFYAGTTSNLDNAIKNHNSGSGSDYTRVKERRPVQLVEWKQVNSKEEAKKVKIELQNKYKLNVL